MSDKDDDKIGERTEDESTNTNVKKEKKSKKKNKSKKNKTKPVFRDSDDDVYDISPAKDRPWSPSQEVSDEEKQTKCRKIGRKNGSKATKQKEKKPLDTYQDMRNDGMGSQKETEIGKSAARTTSTGIGGLATQRKLTEHVNMINVQPVYTKRRLRCDGVMETEKHSGISNIYGPIFPNINGQSSEKSVHVAAKTTMLEVKDNTTDILPHETATYDNLKRDITDNLIDGSQNDKQRKKKGKKKGKKKKELQSEHRKRIIVDPGMFPSENKEVNVAAENEDRSKTTSSTSQNDNLPTCIVNDKENAYGNKNGFVTTNIISENYKFPSSVVEDIEDNVEREFQENAEEESITADPSIDTGQDSIVQNEDLPATLSPLNLNCDCRACVGENGVSTTNNTEMTGQPIGRFRKLLKFLTCCFTPRVED